MSYKMWNNNRVQFARLLAEIQSVGFSKEQIKYLTSEDGMDATVDQLEELLERASQEWIAHKDKVFSTKRK